MPLLLDSSAHPTAADTRVQRERLEGLRAIEAKAKASQEVLVETERDFKAYHGLDKQRKMHDTSTDIDLARLLQEERKLRALPPLADAAALVAHCPEVFRALARGDPLEPLVEAGHLVASAAKNTARDLAGDQHQICFYIREWAPSEKQDLGAILEQIAVDKPTLAPFVEEAKSRPLQRIRYVGMFVDAGRRNRLRDDGIKARANLHQSRLLSFMTDHAPEEEWTSYKVVKLTVDVPAVEMMPVDALFASCGRDMFVDARTRVLPVTYTKDMVSKSANAIVAPVEAALIHCCRIGSVCLNASSWGGFDTLPALAVPQELADLRSEAERMCGKSVPHPLHTFDKALVAQMKRHYECAASFASESASPHLFALNALYASVPSRGCHVSKDITREDLNGQATRFGPCAGPWPASFRNAMDWACDQDGMRDEEDLAQLKMLRASADLWCVDEKHPEE